MKPVVNLYKLGRLPYVKALNLQRVLFDKLKRDVTSQLGGEGAPKLVMNLKLDSKRSFNLRDTNRKSKLLSCFGDGKEKARNSLILVEHQPVYTIGIRTKHYNDDYVSKLKEKLIEHKLNADFISTNRGGLITFHGPGQLVAYPIIYLGDFNRVIQNRSLKAYVNLLETTIIDTLARVGIPGAHTIREYPGVWLGNGERKIAFIGISCKRFITMHGISINCDCDLGWFDHIISCGIEDKLITSIRNELLMANQDYEFGSKQRRQISDTMPNYCVHPQENSSSGLQPERAAICCSGTSSEENFSDDGGNYGLDIENYNSKVEQVSEAFCRSFSQHFDCILMESTL